jgi:hypothetical protein
MKRLIIAVLIGIVAVGAASAQAWNRSNPQWNNQPYGWQSGPRSMPNAPFMPGRGYGYAAPVVKAEEITLEGTLELVNARVAIKKDGKTYFVMIPSRLYGFVDGLKEGASVKVEGYSRELPALKDNFVVQVETLTLGDKTIDLGEVGTRFAGSRGFAPRQARPNRMGGMGRW